MRPVNLDGDACPACKFSAIHAANCAFGLVETEIDENAFDAIEDSVNHPSHYNQGKIEVIEFIEDKELGFHLGNAVKYIARAGKKNPAKYVEDLEKAIWYIRRRIELKSEKPRRPNEMK